ncbi:MAG: hypothetical protein ACRBCL_11025 [Maritimibacter sp.]
MSDEKSDDETSLEEGADQSSSRPVKDAEKAADEDVVQPTEAQTDAPTDTPNDEGEGEESGAADAALSGDDRAADTEASGPKDSEDAQVERDLEGGDAQVTDPSAPEDLSHEAKSDVLSDTPIDATEADQHKTAKEDSGAANDEKAEDTEQHAEQHTEQDADHETEREAESESALDEAPVVADILAVPVPEKDQAATPQAAAIAPVIGVADPDHQRRKRRRRLHIHLGVWSSITVVLIGAFLVLASMSLTGRVVVMPPWLAAKVEEKMNEAMPDGSLTLRQIEFGVTPKGRPRFRLVDVGIRDATGLDIAQLNGVEGGVRLNGLLRGKIEPKSVYLSGAQMTLRRLSDGAFALSFGQSGMASGSLATVLDAIDEVFTTGILAEAEKIQADALTITLEDSRSGRIWQVTDGTMSVRQTARLVESTVRFDVFNQTEDLASTSLTFRSAKGSSEASLAASFQNAAAYDIGAQTPALSFLQLVNAPVSGALRTTIGADGALQNLAGTMEISAGDMQPSSAAAPINFEGAKVYIDFNPDTQRIDISGLSVKSEIGEAQGEGHVYLADFNRGWPGSLLGQISLRSAKISAPELFDEPLEMERGSTDFRLRLDPFEIDIGQAAVFVKDTKVSLKGKIGTNSEGWNLALDARSDGFDVATLKTIWPLTVSPGTRDWIIANVSQGHVIAPHLALRGPSLDEAKVAINGELEGVTARVMDHLPVVTGAAGYVSLGNSKLTLMVDDGVMTAPDGSVMQAGGTIFTVPDVRQKRTMSHVDIAMAGNLRGALELLNLKPFNVFEGTGFAPDVASGTMEGRGRVAFPLIKELPFSEVDFEASGTVFDVASDQLVPGSDLRANTMSFRVDPEVLEVSGPGMIGAVPMTATWRQPLQAQEAAKGSTVTGTIEVSQKLVDEFNLGLPDAMIGGKGRGQFSLLLKGGQSPYLTGSSDLKGVSLSIPGTGWRKAAGSGGALDVGVVLSASPQVDKFAIKAPGLTASGTISTKNGGTFDQARFARVKLGSWLNAPVTITGRGNAPIAISVNGGTADFRTASFETGSGSASSARGAKEPLAIKLDRLTIADGIVLTSFDGDFNLAGGLRGTFTSRVDGGARINGTVAPTDQGTAYRITSKDGGGVMRDIGVFENAQGGDLEVTLAPAKGSGTYEGELTLDDTRVVNAPAMAELLSAVSVVGMLDQLNGPGIGFAEVRARFRMTPKRVTLYSSSAVGVSMGISMDGYYNLDSSTMDMQGVLSPFYLLNSLGRVVSARDGEGLVGFNFNLHGPDDNLTTDINPLSILTPGVFREIFRRPPPTRPAQ